MTTNSARSSWLSATGLLFLGLGAATTIILFGPAELEPRIRTAGGLLQLCGILQVAIGIGEVRESLGIPAVFQEYREELAHAARRTINRARKLLRMKPLVTQVNVSAYSAGSSTATGRARIKVKLGEGASLERRIESLERWINDLDDEVGGIHARIDHERVETQRGIAEERQERRKTDTDLEGLIKSLSVGGVHLEVVGVTWLGIGTFFAVWSLEIAAVFKHLGYGP